nr:unnamed protein product [Callosobruchus chinensis]
MLSQKYLKRLYTFNLLNILKTIICFLHINQVSVLDTLAAAEDGPAASSTENVEGPAEDGPAASSTENVEGPAEDGTFSTY